MALVSGVPAKLIVSQDNTQDIDVFGLIDSSSNFLNNATLTAEILDGNRASVLSGIVMNYVLGSDGDYVGTIPSTFNMTVGTDYTMIIDGDQAASHLHIEIPVEIRVRTH